MHCNVIAALFTIAKIWMQTKCPSTDEWIKMYTHTCAHTHTHNVILLIHKKRKKEKILAFAAMWMDLEVAILSEVGQTEKDKYRVILLTCKI